MVSKSGKERKRPLAHYLVTSQLTGYQKRNHRMEQSNDGSYIGTYILRSI